MFVINRKGGKICATLRTLDLACALFGQGGQRSRRDRNCEFTSYVQAFRALHTETTRQPTPIPPAYELKIKIILHLRIIIHM